MSPVPAVLVFQQRNADAGRISERGPFGPFSFWSVGRAIESRAASGQSGKRSALADAPLSGGLAQCGAFGSAGRSGKLVGRAGLIACCATLQ